MYRSACVLAFFTVQCQQTIITSSGRYMKVISSWLLTGLIWAAFTSSVGANTLPDSNTANHFNVSLDSEFGHIDNFLYQPTQEQSSSYVKLSPGADVQVVSGAQLFSLVLASDIYRYAQFTQDDHSDGLTELGYQYKLDHNKSFFLNGGFRQQSEQRGTGITTGNADSIASPDEWQKTNFVLGYQYGSDESVAKLVVDGGMWQRQYNTRRHVTRRLDQQNAFARVSFDYLLSGKSYVASEASVTKVDFKHNNSLNETKWEALVGYRWQSTDITRLSALVGYQQISFEQSQLADDSSLKWKLDAQWQPTSIFSVTLSTSRDYAEANRLNNSYRVVDSYQVSSSYALHDHLALSAKLGVNNEKQVYSNSSDNEDYLVGEVMLNYNRNEWLSFYGKYIYRSLDNPEPLLNYQRNSFSIGFSVSI